jgi:CBS domain-containing protein
MLGLELLKNRYCSQEHASTQATMPAYILKLAEQYDRSFQMNLADQVKNLKVKDVFNDSIKRPFLFVYPDTKLLEVITFLAIGPKIYVDGVVVIAEQNQDGNKIKTPIGRIGGKHVLSNMLENTVDSQDFLGRVTASQIMVEITGDDFVKLESPLSTVIDIFGRTRFAFVPIISTPMENNNKKPNIIATLSIRDFLPLIANNKVCIDQGETEGIITQISSPLVSVSKDSTIRDAISIMVNKGIRNIGIKKCNQNYVNDYKEKGKLKDQSCIVNDRKIMEFLLSRKRRGESNLIFGSISDLDIIQTHSTKSNITLVEAAQYLINMENQFLILEGNEYIVTPWDLVMKTVGKRDL